MEYVTTPFWYKRETQNPKNKKKIDDNQKCAGTCTILTAREEPKYKKRKEV
jgi:hypothetical protein